MASANVQTTNAHTRPVAMPVVSPAMHCIRPSAQQTDDEQATPHWMNSGFFRCVLPFKWLFWERVTNKLIKLAILSYALAWLLSQTSVEIHVNLPVATAVIVLFYWLSTRLVLSDAARESPSPRTRRYRKFHKPVRCDYYYREKTRDPPDRDAWKKSVNAPIVESAWESFCGSIIQEWIYDSWFAMISPDREFPAEIRRLLNEAFAEVAQRAKRIDLRTLLLRDMCDLFTEQLELYRDTKSAVGILNEGDLSQDKKDRGFQQEMKTNQTLHAAFYSRDGHYRMIRRMAEGVVGLVLSKDDVERPALRSLARELLATCVLRNVIMLFTPCHANKILLSLLTSKKEAKTQSTPTTRSAPADRLTGDVQFEQRVRTSVALEELASKKVKHKKRPMKEQSLHDLPVSKSHPNLQSMEMRRETDDVAEAEISEAQPDRSLSGSSVDLKSVLEETELLAEAKGECEMTECTSLMAPTSLPRIPASATDASVLAGEDTEPVVHLIDSQISIEDISFVGHPRARVVAPEINTNGGREYVVFKIRVADRTGEWTVTRRYRNFEALHKFLRDVPAYRELQPRLPPKTFMFQTHKTEVVEQRRVALDKYLQTILSSDMLAFNRYVWLFLSDQECRSFTPDVRVGLVKTIANNMDNARYRIKRTVADTFKENTSKADLKKENALRLLDGSESSSIAGSVKIEDDSETTIPSVKPRPQNGDRPSLSNAESPMRHNASLPEGLSAMVLAEGRRSPKERKKPHKTVGLTALDAYYGSSKRVLPGDLINANLLSRFDFQDRDAIGRQAEKNAAKASSSTGRPLLRTGSFNRIGSGEFPGPDEEDETLEAVFDDYSGISAPLYEVADAIFNFPAQQFFRRQVFQVMRQVLSFLAGDAIDVYLNEEIKHLRSEHVLARMIHFLKSTLWPDGVWFSMNQKNDPSDSCASKGMQFDTYLDATAEEPDAKEVAKNLRDRLLLHPPAAIGRLIRLLGRDSYMRAMKDVYDLLQLPTFVRQIGYGVVEIVLLALFPELKDLFAKIHREARFMPEFRR